MHKYRRKAAYDIFVRQFLQVGRKCLEFENHKFVPMYVRQARRLADLLREDHFESDAQDLHEMVKELEVLQKLPGVTRSQSNADAKRNHEKEKSKPLPPPLKKIEIWRPPASEPSTPDQVISPVSFYPMSPELVEKRKSILKNGPSVPRSPPKLTRQHLSNNGTNKSSHNLSIKADIHRGDTISAKASMPTTATPTTSPISRPLTFNFNRTAVRMNDSDDNGRDYKKITAIELIDKGGVDVNNRHVTILTSQMDAAGGQEDSHVSIL